MPKIMKYTVSKEKYDEICKQFDNISTTRLYSEMLKIGTKEYVKFLNSFENMQVMVSNSKQSFAIYSHTKGKYIVNDKLVKKSIDNAHKKRELRTIEFFYSNVVLEKLLESLTNISK